MTETVELVDVTPDLAREWLGYNTHNRNIRQGVVLAYAADMTEGHWLWNGESLKFSVTDVLLDGQHRLLAVIDAGVTVKMLVVRGLPDETQETIDGGAKRRFGDLLRLRGEVNTALLAAITRRVHIWETGARRIGTKVKYPPTNAQLLQTLEKYPGLRDVTRDAQLTALTCGLPGSILGLGMHLFTQLAPDDAEFFFARLGDGQNMGKGNPMYELRRAAANYSTANIRAKRSETYLAAIMIKAWNAYRDGEQTTLLSYRPGGRKPERFPEPH